VKPLIRSLQRDDWEGTPAAVEALARFDPIPREAIPPLVRIMREYAEEKREARSHPRGGLGRAAAE
jgi:hypothetical protein